MTLSPEIITLPTTLLAGQSVETTMATQIPATIALWKQFAPRKKEISQAVNPAESYSLAQYLEPPKPDGSNKLIKWAAIAISASDNLPEGLQTLIIEEGLYAKFTFKGLGTTFPAVIQSFHTEWLPNSDFILRPGLHFELLDHRYLGLDNPESQEDIYIPVSPK